MKNIRIKITVFLLTLIMFTGCFRLINDRQELMEIENETDTFPTKAIRLVIPFAPGGGTDGVGRALALSCEGYVEQPIIPVNKLGDSGSRGLREGIFSNNDGYTITVITSEINSLSSYGLIDFDYQHMELLMLLNTEPGILVVSKDFPFDTIEELIADYHKNDKTYTIGSAGKGSVWNFAAKGIALHTDLQFEDRYYDGTSLAVLDVLQGKTDMVISGVSEVIEHIEAGEIKVLTVLADDRLDALPDLKTFTESGYDFSIYTWRGLAIPKDTDHQIKEYLLERLTKAAKDEQFISLLKELNLHYDYRPQEAFLEFIQEDLEVYRKLLEIEMTSEE
ncbi:tripartite tricarboxylate transporter substrate binding protein [Vallitalea pronyensis]|uniref:Tripartite tricarboxylate transporter substrate binding protein n=1 Tax=Vallitalea pronyensis TaxID=1348613 RepID=A0A8J8SH96_9FIRM|nr:tripartite tricarboxylate transporter substrate binding protein [Vallitalea pronyensis]QUI23187.1 tripartite tricarboxylate transporter substrate binding protein [Vallitalea pronyensis]